MSEEEKPDLFWYRVKFLALVAVFLLPFIAGWLAFYVFEYRPAARNYGELVEPPRALQFAPLVTHDGSTLDGEFWNKWTFVLIDANGCAQQCRDNLYYLRQMRTALGRDQDRVQNLALLGEPLSAELGDFFKDYPRMNVVSGIDSRILAQFELPGVVTGAEPMLYLIDPAGNLMMTYPAEHDPSLVLSDIRRLLKVSQIG